MFSASCELRVSSYGPKTVPKSLRVLMRTLLGFSRNNCVGVARIVTPHLHYWTRARSVRRSSFIVFSINLVTWRPSSPAEKAIAYITCGCSVLAGEYERVATARFRRWVPVISNMCSLVRIVTPHLHYWTRARSVRRSSFIVFSINLVTWRPSSPAEKAIAYITCGCSVLAGEYESVATARFRRWVPVSSNMCSCVGQKFERALSTSSSPALKRSSL